jgi:tRNA-Thr(GGU) m(6)t(6)A37 methyltransferase TsaA
MAQSTEGDLLLMKLVQIGVIHSPYRNPTGAPIQSSLAGDVEGWVEVFPDYAQALSDLEGFERIWLIYWFDRAASYQPIIIPFMDENKRGLFATRAPSRPNPIGMSCVRLLALEGRRLRIAGVDMTDGTPLLDIKPYVTQFDAHMTARAGWLEGKLHQGDQLVKADNRFEKKEP